MSATQASVPDDPVWADAWAWVQRQHDAATWDDEALTALARWLAEDPGHRQAYDKARRLWLLTGLVPPSGDGPLD
ncbi:FecR/PupR family sigma factor regulator [Roseateles sp.]|uniref:FecR/PupR family sigma factor regulator n=1 Tax=Roseateles sp. TaxID=1971397 RepID=UPI0039E9BC7B